MMIKSLSLRDYCGYVNANLKFGNFTCLIGPNGCGKTTILNAISLLTSSLDFKSDESETPGGWVPTISPEQRLKAFLRKNIRNIDEGNEANGFRAEAIFTHEGKDYEVVLTEKGFEKNELISQSFWWAGLCYPAKFDTDMVNFQLRYDLWPRFKKAFEGITGIKIEPHVYTETDLKTQKKNGECTDYVIGFDMLKPGGKVNSRKASAGERKIAKALSQVVNLEESRRPDIVLIDNLEMHAHYRRHLSMVTEMKDLFTGIQIVATTHSQAIIDYYHPQSDIIDVEKIQVGGADVD